jgi:hypothetical protein
LTLTSVPASAKPRHHGRHHHHHPQPTPIPPIVTCGPGTVFVATLNQCFPVGPGTGGGGGGFFGGAGITISPATVQLTAAAPPIAGQGSFSQSFTMTGVPPLTSFNVTGGDANCPMTGGGAVATTPSGSSIAFTLANAAGTCKQGGHPVTATSTGGTPFTAFVTFTS